MPGSPRSPVPRASRPLAPLACAALSAVVGGWADAASYLRFHIFSGAMNGNTVLLGLSLVGQSRAPSLYCAAVMLAFIGGILGARLAGRDRAGRRSLLFAAALLIAGSGLVGDRWTVCLMSLALGAQNETIRAGTGLAINTVFVTGDIEHLAQSLPEAGLPRQRRRALTFAAAWLAYGLGAVAGGATRFGGPWILCLPALLILAAAALLPPSRH